MKHARKSPWRLLYKLHRYCGLVVAVVAIVLSLTGIALNHTEDLQLDSRFVKSATVLDWYGITINTEGHAFQAGNHWLSQQASQVYFNEQLIFKLEQSLRGAIATEAFIVVAHPALLTLLSLEGELIEQISQSNLVQAIGVNRAGDIVISSNEKIYRSEDALLSWQVDTGSVIQWSKADTLPDALVQPLQQQARQHILPYERVVLDLHSARLFGKVGGFIVDLAALMLIFLALSGTWIWLRPKLKRRSASSRSS